MKSVSVSSHARALRRSVALLLVFLSTTLGACVSRQAHESVVNRAEHSERALAEMKDYCTSVQEENNRLRSQARDLERRAADADWIKSEKERLSRILAGLDTSGTGAKGSGIEGVEVISTAEGIGFSIQGEVLFASGSNEISTQGKAALSRLLPVLRDDKEQRIIRVDGHTDSDPILRSSWKTNLRLSVERSMAVADFLLSGGVPEARATIAGYGPNRPRRAGSTAEAKRENRRVEVLLLNKN